MVLLIIINAILFLSGIGFYNLIYNIIINRCKITVRGDVKKSLEVVLVGTYHRQMGGGGLGPNFLFFVIACIRSRSLQNM